MSACPIRDAILDSLAAEAGPARAEHLRHAQSCPDCRELLPLLAGIDAPAVRPPESLAGSVFARTAGSACEQAAGSLVDPPDDPVGQELLRAHVDDCEPCTGLEQALLRLAVDLPAMGELDPGPAFTAAVVARTSGTAIPVASTILERLQGMFAAFARRPRFALELSYVGALVVWVLFGVPGVASVTRLASFMQEVPATVVEGTGQLTLDTARLVGVSADRVLRESGSNVRGELNERFVRTAPARRSLALTSVEIRDAALELDVSRTSKLAGELGSQLMRLPQQFLMEPAAQEEAPPNGNEDDDHELPEESNHERSC